MTPLIWLVTGCSSGFGEQFVHSLIPGGDKIIASGHNALLRLQHLRGTSAHILDLDVTAPQSEFNEKVAEAIAVYGGIDVLVNNAAYVQSGAMEELSPEMSQASFNTNFFGVLNLTRAVLPHLRSKQSGTLVFIGSQGGLQAEACTSSYNTTKFALEGKFSCVQDGAIQLVRDTGLVESLNKELIGFGIKSIIFEPGLYRTEAFSDRNMHFNPPIIPTYAEQNRMMKDFLQSMHNNQPGDPRKAVERMTDVVEGKGMAKEKGCEFPVRMPMGRDCLAAVREKSMSTLKICHEWEGADC